MGRWLMFGCFGLLLFLGLAGVGTWIFVLQPAQRLVKDVQEVVTQEKGVQNQAPFTPPSNNQLSPTQLQRYMQVQRTVKSGLGERYTRLEARFRQLAEQQRTGGNLDYRGLLDLFNTSTPIIRDAKKIQVAALNQQKFSPEEYKWVKNQVYSALGYGIPIFDPTEIMEQIGRGDFKPKVEMHKVPVLAATQRMVEPLREELKGYYPFTWFGM